MQGDVTEKDFLSPHVLTFGPLKPEQESLVTSVPALKAHTMSTGTRCSWVRFGSLQIRMGGRSPAHLRPTSAPGRASEDLVGDRCVQVG
jgi:hypothetical protein